MKLLMSLQYQKKSSLRGLQPFTAIFLYLSLSQSAEKKSCLLSLLRLKKK